MSDLYQKAIRVRETDLAVVAAERAVGDAKVVLRQAQNALIVAEVEARSAADDLIEAAKVCEHDWGPSHATYPRCQLCGLTQALPNESEK